MDRVTLKANGRWWQPLTWFKNNHGNVLITCPNGHTGSLDHSIADNGDITPSLVCPVEGCGWHVWGRLEGWDA